MAAAAPVLATVAPLAVRWAGAYALAQLDAERIERRNARVEQNLGLCKAIALQVRGMLPVTVDLEDLVQAGMLGLLDAASRFNPYQGVTFPNYAKHRIRGAIYDYLRALDTLSRESRRLLKLVDATSSALHRDLGRLPTTEEIAEHVRLPLTLVRYVQALANYGTVSLDSRANMEDDQPVLEAAAPLDREPNADYARTECQRILEEAYDAAGLTKNERAVVTLYYQQDLTMKQVGERLGVNESRVSQLSKQVCRKLRPVLEARGITSSAAFAC